MEDRVSSSPERGGGGGEAEDDSVTVDLLLFLFLFFFALLLKSLDMARDGDFPERSSSGFVGVIAADGFMKPRLLKEGEEERECESGGNNA